MRFCAALVLLAALAPSSSQACSIPVFRYALERWQASPYEVLVYHRGPMAMVDRQALRELNVLTHDSNLEITEVDLDRRVDKESQAIWNAFGKDKALPWVMVRFPDSEPKSALAWSGPLDVSKLRLLIDSPGRQQIVRRLFNGASMVFVLLQSGDASADAAAGKLLELELPRLAKNIKLGPLAAEGPQLLSEVPLTVSFPMLRLSHTDAAEQAFVDLLLGCGDKLDKAKGPIVFAIYGRGRVLTALHGKDLKASELETVARFVCGDCSCQVKEFNPGADMLFQTRWEAFLEIEIAPSPREPKDRDLPLKR